MVQTLCGAWGLEALTRSDMNGPMRHLRGKWRRRSPWWKEKHQLHCNWWISDESAMNMRFVPEIGDPPGNPAFQFSIHVCRGGGNLAAAHFGCCSHCRRSSHCSTEPPISQSFCAGHGFQLNMVKLSIWTNWWEIREWPRRPLHIFASKATSLTSHLPAVLPSDSGLTMGSTCCCDRELDRQVTSQDDRGNGCVLK